MHVLDSALILPRGSGTRANKRVRGNLLVGEDALAAVQEPEDISEAPVPPELRVLDAGENLSDNLASGTNGPPPAKRRKRDIPPSQNESRSRDRSHRDGSCGSVRAPGLAVPGTTSHGSAAARDRAALAPIERGPAQDLAAHRGDGTRSVDGHSAPAYPAHGGRRYVGGQGSLETVPASHGVDCTASGGDSR